MSPEQAQTLLNQVQALTKIVGDLSTVINQLQNGNQIPNNIEGAFRNRLFQVSPISPDLFTQTLSSTPGGVRVPIEGVEMIELVENLYVMVYRKL